MKINFLCKLGFILTLVFYLENSYACYTVYLATQGSTQVSYKNHLSIQSCTTDKCILQICGSTTSNIFYKGKEKFSFFIKDNNDYTLNVYLGDLSTDKNTYLKINNMPIVMTFWTQQLILWSDDNGVYLKDSEDTIQKLVVW